MLERIEKERRDKYGNTKMESANVLTYYTEEQDEVGGTPRNYAVIIWLSDGVVERLRVQHADNCEDVDGITVLNRMWNVIVSRNSNGIVHTTRKDAEKMRDHFNDQLERLVELGLWNDSEGFSGCELNLTISEVWI